MARNFHRKYFEIILNFNQNIVRGNKTSMSTCGARCFVEISRLMFAVEKRNIRRAAGKQANDTRHRQYKYLANCAIALDL